jgi:protein TonB
MFEATLIASRRTRSGRGTLAGVPVAVAIHGAVLGLFCVAQLWAVEPVPEPYVSATMVVFQPPAPPPGLPPGQTSRPEAAKRVARPTRETVVQPNIVPGVLPPKLDHPVDDNPNAVEGGFPPEDGTGHGSGETGERVDPVDQEPPVVPDDPPIVVGGRLARPALLHQVQPAYPDAARTLRIHGAVIVQATIDKYGNVVDATVLRGIGFGCDEAALDAIRQWKYERPMLNGKPVAVYLTVTFTFTLH